MASCELHASDTAGPRSCRAGQRRARLLAGPGGRWGTCISGVARGGIIMAIHTENFVSIRKLYPRITERVQSRMAVADPADASERDYRDLLSEANLNYFHREYS